MYHDNPVINNIVLTIINDGNGSECGKTYDQRLQYGRNRNRTPFYRMVGRVASDNGDRISGMVAGDIVEIIYNYYVNHANECAAYARDLYVAAQKA